MRLTVGPLPPAVYWRRRAVVLAIALLVLFVLFQACSAAGSSGEQSSDQTGDPDRTSTEGPAAGEGEGGGDGDGEDDGDDAPPDVDAPEPGSADDDDGQLEPDVAAGPPVGANFCHDDEIEVRAEAAHTELAAGESVRFTIAVGNESGRTCRRDVGGDERELYLRHVAGANVVWSSRDCGGPTGSDERDLPAPIEMDWYIEWNGESSRTCEGVVPAGGPVEPGEYHLFSRLGTAHSEPLLITVG